MSQSEAPARSTTKSKPRYLELADKLREEIIELRTSDSKLATFPTESALCQKYQVSRFTVREALRKLTDEGLIARKRGSGTIVQPATVRAGAVHQPLSNFGEILQYAHDTTIRFKREVAQRIPAKICEQLNIQPKREWFVFYGRRRKAGHDKPIALTIAWIHPDLADIVETIDTNRATLFGQIEESGKLRVGKVTQAIQAIAASPKFAQDLGLAEGDPILRILRCYYDEKGRMFEISASYHPGDSFAYAMHMTVE